MYHRNYRVYTHPSSIITVYTVKGINNNINPVNECDGRVVE